MEKTERENMKQFVTFEGIDGSGKTTIAKSIYKQLLEQGITVEYTYEPTNTMIGRCVQHYIETQCNPYATAFTFIADRIEHCKQINQWLQQKKLVLCDRYAESTYAYQGAQLQNDIDLPMKWLQELSEKHILTPDRTYIFDINPELSLKRIAHRDKLIPFERVSFLKQVRHNYLQLIHGNRFVKIDATHPQKAIIEELLQDILL